MNRTLSDSFIEIFLPALKSHHLCELYISGLNMTPRSCPHIVAYLSSPTRCRLRSFSCNGNTFGLRGVRSIIEAIQRHNLSIPIVELHANQLSGAHGGAYLQYNLDAWKVSEALLSRILTRNRLLKHEIERQALRLLRYARPLLLQTSLPPLPPSSTPHIPENPPLFLRLPIELQQYILSLFGPTLSTAQRTRIFNYASIASTLPSLLPHLSSGVLWPGEQAGARWLREIGCDGYELEEDEEPDGERVRWTIEMANMPWRA